MPVRGLTVIVGSGSSARLGEAVALLAAQSALEGGATLFCIGDAVRWLAEARAPLSGHLDELLDSGGRIIVCQTSLAEQGVSMAQFDARIEGGGMVSLLQQLGEDRLLAL